MEVVKDTISWFEIPVTDFERGIKFYETLYEQKLTRIKMEGADMAFLPVGKEGVSGALVCGEHYQPSQVGTLVYLDGGDDLNQLLERVSESGGKVLNTKMQISEEIGYCAFFLDSEGNKLGLFSKK